MSEINKNLLIKELKKIDVLSTSILSIPSTNNFSDSTKPNKKEVELFGSNSLANNKRQPTEYEENPQQLSTTEDNVKKEDRLKKRSRTNVDDAINDQMGWNLILLSSSIPATDLNVDKNNHNLSVASSLDKVESNLAPSFPFTIAKSTSENQIMDRQQ
ncbi:2350_t:CDS:1, partial [Ambispora gerdemannii]